MNLISAQSVSLEHGRLYIEEAHRVLRLQAWPRPGAWAGTTRESCRTPIECRLGLKELEKRRRFSRPPLREPCAAFLKTIPGPVRRRLIEFPEHGIRLLRFAWQARVEALELAESNRGLALAIACGSMLKSDPRDWKEPRELVKLKRKRILDWLEFPSTKSVVAILAKLTDAALFVRHLRKLRALLQENNPRMRKALSHVDEINPEVLAFVDDPLLLAQVEHGFLEEASRMLTVEPHLARRVTKFRDDYPKFHGENRPIPILRNIDQLDALTREMEPPRPTWFGAAPPGVVPNAGDAVLEALAPSPRSRDRPFPPPPFPGDRHVIPITTWAELRAEGFEMSHCVSSYTGSVVLGRKYFYCVLGAERCTLSLDKRRSGWVLTEVRGKRNEDVRKRVTRRAIREWRTQHGIGTSLGAY